MKNNKFVTMTYSYLLAKSKFNKQQGKVQYDNIKTMIFQLISFSYNV